MILLLFAVFAVLVTVDYAEKLNRLSPYGYERSELAKEIPISALQPGESFSQEIPYDADLMGVSLAMNIYERGNSGTLLLTATGNHSGEVLAKERYRLTTLVLEGRADLLFEKTPAAEDDAVVLTVTAEGATALITAWATAEDAVPDAALTVADETQAGDLVFERIVRTPGRYTYVTVVYCLMLAVTAGGVILLLYSRAGTARLAFVLVFAIGMLYLLVMSPLSVPDEQTHYQTAYRLSSVMMFRQDEMNKGDRAYFDYHGLGGHYNLGTGYDRIAEELTQPKAEKSGTRKLKNRIDYALMYVPQAIGLTIGRLLGLNFILLFWTGRICNLLFYALCVYLAVRAATRFRALLALSALTPMAMQQAASFSYDTFINGLSLLLIALLLRAADRKGRMQTGEYLALLAVTLLMAPAKAVYTPLLALLLFIPAERFGGKRQKAVRIGYLWFAALAAVALFQIGGIRNVVTSGGGEANWEGSTNYTLSYLLTHPQETADLFLSTLRTNLSEWPYQAVGSRLSGMTLEVTAWKISAYMGLLILASQCSEGNELTVRGTERAAFLGITVITVLLVMLTMLLNWTSQNETMIQGIQGRYFIPVMPLLWMCLNNRVVRLNRNPERFLLICAVALHLAVLSGVMRLSVLTV